MKWKDKLINLFVEELRYDSKWSKTIEKVLSDKSIGIHLAIFQEPFLSLVLNGEKKLESRFSVNKISPFGRISNGDIIMIKEPGRYIIGAFIAKEIKYFNIIHKRDLNEIKNKYSKLICSEVDNDFWKNRSLARYATLITIENVSSLKPLISEKNDRMGWSILREGITNFCMENYYNK